MNIALIAHDKKKEEMIEFVKDNEELFAKHNLFKATTSFCSSSSAKTSVRPKHKEHHNSNPKISKQIVVSETQTLSGLKSIAFFMPSTKLCKFLCVIITPLGFPVEPDV